MNLLEQFMVQECTPHVRRLLKEAIAGTSMARHRFEFNRFEVTIDRDNDEVVLEDVLDATEAGVDRIPLSVLENAVNR
jgi:hypothetical protein